MTAVHHKLPIKVVMFNNSASASLRWKPRALAFCALGDCNDLYFADHLQWAGFSYLKTKDLRTLLGCSSILLPHPTVKSVWCCHNSALIPSAVNEFIAHISSIVYRQSTLSTCRFDEELRWAGEDDLFLLELLFASTYTCISGETEVELGLGENIFCRSWSWDIPTTWEGSFAR
jgi:hypothetical protein